MLYTNMSWIWKYVFMCVILCNVQSQNDETPEIYKLHINTDITYRFATTNVVSQIANVANEAREIFFKIYLPKSAFISHFEMTIDGVVYPGEVKEKEVAQKQYDKAKSKGQTAGQVSQTARDNRQFKVSVNVAAGKKVHFNMTYEELLERKLGKYQHIINIDPGQVVRDLQVNVNIRESRDIVDLRVPDLIVSLDNGISDDTENDLAQIVLKSPREASVYYHPSVADQKIQSSQGLSGQFMVQYDVERDIDAGEIQVVDGYFVHYFAPQGLPSVDKNVIFILDDSGSMSGRKLNQVKASMKTILPDLGPDDMFGVVLFHNSIQNLWGKSGKLIKPATWKNIQKAFDFINRHYDADGGTDINNSLQFVLGKLEALNTTSDRPSIIVFLTDGEPTSGVTNTKSIIDNFSTRNDGKYTLFSLGFGDGADYPFLQKISLQNKGFARKIYEASDASLQLEGFYDEISTPTISNLKIDYLDDAVDESTLTNNIFSNYFDGSEIVIAGKLTDNTINTLSSSISGEAKDRDLDLQLDVSVSDSQSEMERSDLSKFTERLWGYLTIKKLLTDMKESQNTTTKEELKQKALDLSLKYGFVTPLTSMVVTKPEDPVDLANKTTSVGSLKDVDKIKDVKPAPVRPPRKQSSFSGRRGGGSFADNDPHFVVSIPGWGESVCFDVDGKNGAVLQLLHDKVTGLTVNGKIVYASVAVPNKKPRSYFGKLHLLSPGLKLVVQPTSIRVFGDDGNEDRLEWHKRNTYTYGEVTITIERKRAMYIDYGNGVVLGILRHMEAIKNPLKVDYLGFYIAKGKGLSKYTHGLIGQFQHQVVHQLHSDIPNPNTNTTILKFRGPRTPEYQVKAHLGKRRNMELGTSVNCWHVRNNGRGLLDGKHTDYAVKSMDHQKQAVPYGTQKL